MLTNKKQTVYGWLDLALFWSILFHVFNRRHMSHHAYITAEQNCSIGVGNVWCFWCLLRVPPFPVCRSSSFTWCRLFDRLADLSHSANQMKTKHFQAFQICSTYTKNCSGYGVCYVTPLPLIKECRNRSANPSHVSWTTDCHHQL